MDAGLRSLPLAALHDGKQFLVEKYSLALILSVSLMETRYQSLKGAQVLAMGASKFSDQNPLPAVPVELQTIPQQLREGQAFLNEAFTRNNLNDQRQNYPYHIVHLATHGSDQVRWHPYCKTLVERRIASLYNAVATVHDISTTTVLRDMISFQPGDISNSYIALWNDKLHLDELRNLRLNNPAVELLVLSACRTAVGDEKAELGESRFCGSGGGKISFSEFVVRQR
jgi:CHAT domain-containing protein